MSNELKSECLWLSRANTQASQNKGAVEFLKSVFWKIKSAAGLKVLRASAAGVEKVNLTQVGRHEGGACGCCSPTTTTRVCFPVFISFCAFISQGKYKLKNLLKKLVEKYRLYNSPLSTEEKLEFLK